MKISKRGLDELIKAHEGYHARQADGSCKAYKCPAGVWTCGWGCTEGVNQHTHWTQDEATEALAREMAKHEAAVEGMVRVPLVQGQFDALVSLCYNIGAGNLKSSTLLRHLNSGDYARAASHFADFKYARVDGDTATRMKVKPGTKVVLPGLVERRANETRMFLEANPVLDAMPQKVAPPRRKFDVKQIATTAVATVTTGSAVATQMPTVVPPAPKGATETISNIASWGRLIPHEQWQVLLVGAGVFGLTALAVGLWQKRSG